MALRACERGSFRTPSCGSLSYLRIRCFLDADGGDYPSKNILVSPSDLRSSSLANQLFTITNPRRLQFCVAIQEYVFVLPLPTLTTLRPGLMDGPSADRAVHTRLYFIGSRPDRLLKGRPSFSRVWCSILIYFNPLVYSLVICSRPLYP